MAVAGLHRDIYREELMTAKCIFNFGLGVLCLSFFIGLLTLSRESRSMFIVPSSEALIVLLVSGLISFSSFGDLVWVAFL
jgi:hypothetical protein